MRLEGNDKPIFISIIELIKSSFSSLPKGHGVAGSATWDESSKSRDGFRSYNLDFLSGGVFWLEIRIGWWWCLIIWAYLYNTLLPNNIIIILLLVIIIILVIIILLLVIYY